MLETSNLQYSYPGEAPLTFPDITCRKGEHWLILGKSGGGKTTLLHLLAGLRTPARGDVHVAGTAISKLGSGELDHFRGKHIGIIFQQAHFVRSLNVVENLALAQHLAGATVDHQRIEEVLEHLHMAHKLTAKPDHLSAGEQQRVAIARSIINKPDVILADEPTSALDDVNTDKVVQLLTEQAEEVDATLIIVTHDTRLKEKFEKRITL